MGRVYLICRLGVLNPGETRPRSTPFVKDGAGLFNLSVGCPKSWENPPLQNLKLMDCQKLFADLKPFPGVESINFAAKLVSQLGNGVITNTSSAMKNH